MFNLRSLFETPYGYYDYIWVDVILIKETQKALLIEFDDQRIWLPKVWIAEVKSGRDGLVRIKLSEYHWAKKFF